MILDRFIYGSLFNLCLSYSGSEILYKDEASSARISFLTHSYRLDLFKLNEPLNLPNQFSIDGFLGWIVFIEKLRDDKELITISLETEPVSKNFKTDIATGEGLLAGEVYSSGWQLYNGTHDESVYFYRSKNDLVFPKRFSQQYSRADEFWTNIVQITDLGLIIQVPELLEKEKICFPLLSAWKLNPSKDDISAWVAVDARWDDFRTQIKALQQQIG